jgi:hypothetical protein
VKRRTIGQSSWVKYSASFRIHSATQKTFYWKKAKADPVDFVVKF